MIDRNAPVRASGEIEIQATEELVWEVMTDLERWPKWNSDVKSVSFWGAIRPGTEFRWRVIAGTITSRFQEVEQPRLLAWTGRLSPLGIEAMHVWKLEAKTGATLVRTEESWGGLVVRALRGRARSMLQTSLDKGLEALKAECERRVGGEEPERTPVEDA
jgi:uncharacterized protein YndB with AHSA1/START domain